MSHRSYVGVSGGVEDVKIDKLLILLAAPAVSNQRQTVVSGTPWLRRGWLTSDLVKGRNSEVTSACLL